MLIEKCDYEEPAQAPELCHCQRPLPRSAHANRSCQAEQLLHAVGALSELALAVLAKEPRNSPDAGVS